MKSYIRTIIMLGVIALLTVSSTLAQETPGETATAGSLQPAAAVPSPSKEPVPPDPPLPPPSGTASFTSVATVADAFELAEEPPRGAYTYVNLPPTAAGSSSSRKVLVIPNAEIKAEDLAVITQDLQVMAHIFHKIFAGPQLVEGIFMNYGDFFGRGSRATEAVYLQGYGALFLMEVNIPLSSPPKAKEQEQDENTEKADSVWKQAQQEIFHTPPTRSTRTFDSTEIYNAEKVEELKSRLIKALKHAANMKNLEPDELIILTAIGKGRSYSGDVYSYGRASGGGYSSGLSDYEGVGATNVGRNYSRTRGRYGTTRIVTGGTGGASSTVLTIRAKKSDIDAFAKGDLDYDKFREKVQILSYPSLGQQVVRGNRLFRYRKPHEPSEDSVAPNSTNNKDNRF
ncbi:MAG: hypothetical protein ACYSUY_19715 [Planctomycetota bacterium]